MSYKPTSHQLRKNVNLQTFKNEMLKNMGKTFQKNLKKNTHCTLHPAPCILNWSKLARFQSRREQNDASPLHAAASDVKLCNRKPSHAHDAMDPYPGNGATVQRFGRFGLLICYGRWLGWQSVWLDML